MMIYPKKGQIEGAKVKILHLLSSRYLSGAENVAADICMMFHNDYEMVYCSPMGPIEGALKDRNVNYIAINRATVREIKKVIENEKPHIIHAHDPRATFLATITSGSRPVVSHLHGNHEDMNRFTIKSFLYLIASLKVHNIIAVCNGCVEKYVFQSLISTNVATLHNIVYTPRIEKLIEKDQNQYEFDFVFLGRLSYPKHPERVARVASNVLKTLPNAKFGIIGGGELRNIMLEEFIRQGVESRVVFTGVLPYPYKALRRAKCMLMCSRFEGRPIAALEAMALGVPIISTPVDGLEELVCHGATGFLSDNDQELSHYVEKVLLDEELHRKLAKTTIQTFHNINLEKSYKQKLKNIYDQFA